MEENSLHRKEINWIEFKEKVYLQTRGIKTIDSLVAQYPLFFKWLNDFHGAVTLDGKWIKWREGRPSRKMNAMMDSVFKRGPGLKVDRWDDIGYFRMPPVPALAPDIPKWTQKLVDSLCRISPATAKGWIIDLRLNGGGNIWPMLTSLASLIGEGTVGGIKYIDGREDSRSFIEHSKPYGNNQFYSIPNQTCVLPTSDLPVAVLIGPATGSSGEGLLLAFKGRPNTVIIGEPSSGYVTSNSNWPLHKRVELFLATGYMKDRQGNYYTDSIQPDLFIKDGDDFYQPGQDLKISKAKEWLKTRMK